MSVRGRTLWCVLVVAALSAPPLILSACLGEIGPTKADLELRVPMRDGFDRVADALQPSCGTLDCHGQAQRNWRLFGGRGLRLASTNTPGEGKTTAEEYEANYWAVVVIEPEILSQVLADKGRDPERLILIRKGRGTTRHKGGTLMRPNDPLDTCLTEWLKGNLAADSCLAAAKITASPVP